MSSLKEGDDQVSDKYRKAAIDETELKKFKAIQERDKLSFTLGVIFIFLTEYIVFCKVLDL